MSSWDFYTFMETQSPEYLQLIHEAQAEDRGLDSQKGYQVHHIHPRGLGGSVRSKDNLVKLSMFEHCKAHAILARDYPCQATMRPLIRMDTAQYRAVPSQEQQILDTEYRWKDLVVAAHKFPITEATRAKASKSRTGLVCMTNNKRERMVSKEVAARLEKQGWYHGHTDEHLQKGSKQSRGRVYVHTYLEERLIWPDQVQEYLDKGYSIGRTPEHNAILKRGRAGKTGHKPGWHPTEDTRQRMSLSHLGNAPSNKGRVSMVKDGVKRYIKVEEVELMQVEGWIIGDLPFTDERRRRISEGAKGQHWDEARRARKSEWAKGRVSNTRGRRRMYKDDAPKPIMVKPEDIERRIQEGWRLNKHL